MEIDPGTAYLASTGANILAGAFSSGTGGNKRNQRDYIEVEQQFAEPNRRKNALWGLENIYGRQIQTKVKDAKAAGLHPLFAMGNAGYAPPATNSASPMPGQSRSGSFARDAMQAVAQGMGQIAGMQAKSDLLEKEIELSKLAIATQPGNGNDGALGIEGTVMNSAAARHAHRDKVKLEPNVQRTRASKDSSLAAGSNPAWMEVEIWPGIFIDVPWSEEGFAESIDGLPQIAVTVARNTGVAYHTAYKALKSKLYEFQRSRRAKPSTAKAVPLKHPGAYRRRNYAGPQPYKPRGYRR